MFRAKLGTLPPAQRRLLEELGGVPRGFVLYASPLDLAATKVKAVQDRAESKDYLDVSRLLEEGIGLREALTPDDLAVARRCFPESAFRAVLAHPPPGIFDPRSWAYWHVVFGLQPPPDLPRRELPG
jgi:Nucleotidyl transferase AbiEii toxin, Type IV TA system